MTIYLGLPLPTASSVLPDRQAGSLIAVLFGLATGGVYTASFVTKTAVGSYPAFSPLPVFPEKPSAVCFLLHFPSAHAAWPLASTLPCAARTFLPPCGERSRFQLQNPQFNPVLGKTVANCGKEGWTGSLPSRTSLRLTGRFGLLFPVLSFATLGDSCCVACSCSSSCCSRPHC